MPTAVANTQSASNKLLEVPDYNDFDKAKPRIQKIIDDWVAIEKETERLRALRYVRVDKESLKADGVFAEDETYTPIRLIDQNVRGEQPQFIAYLTQSRRAAIFLAKTKPIVPNIETLEKKFTDVARYTGWEKPFIRVIDGSSTHGWDSIEVVLDTSKPGHFDIEHVGHENLLFDQDAEDINNQEIVIRIVKLTSIQLRQNVAKFNFDPEQVAKLIESDPNNEQQTKDIQYTLYKCFYRDQEDSIINVGWYHNKCDDWIRSPMPLFLGMRDISAEKDEQQLDGSLDFPKIFETEYPFYLLPYDESENARITEIRGRAFRDEPAQEAASAILSGIVNGTTRAANMFGAVKNNPADQNTAPPKQVPGIVIKNGVIWDKEIAFSHLDYPPISAVQALQSVTTSNKAETAKVDTAVENRKDSRKTATEIQASLSEAARLSSVQVTMLSIFIRQVYQRCWAIYRNRVLQQKITIEDQQLLQIFTFDYEIKSSGDIDVIQRQEKLQRQMQAWPVVSKTPIAQMFMEDYLRMAFPDDAQRYINKLNEIDPRALVIACGEIIKALVIDPATGQLEPQFRQFAGQLMKLNEQITAYLQQSQATDLAAGTAQAGADNQEQVADQSDDQTAGVAA